MKLNDVIPVQRTRRWTISMVLNPAGVYLLGRYANGATCSSGLMSKRLEPLRSKTWMMIHGMRHSTRGDLSYHYNYDTTAITKTILNTLGP